MKYIMLETAEGQKLPFIFPDALTHLFVAETAVILVRSTLKQSCHVTSAGFVSLGKDIATSGASESLGGLQARETDAAVIGLGEAAAFMPVDMIGIMWDLAKQRG